MILYQGVNVTHNQGVIGRHLGGLWSFLFGFLLELVNGVVVGEAAFGDK